MYKKFLKKIVSVVAFSALIVILMISCIYMISMVNFSSDNIDNTNAAYCRQVTNAMEMLVKQARHQAYRFILDDNGITELVKQMRTKRSTVRELMSMLTKTLQNDPYYESVYLYSEEDKLLMTTTHWGGTSLYDEADFGDQEIIEACQKGKSVMLEPRVVSRVDQEESSEAQALILPIIIPIKETTYAKTACMLVINVNIGDIFDNLLKDVGASEGINVYVTNKSGKIIIAQDWSCIGTDLSDFGYDDYPDTVLDGVFTRNAICYRAENKSDQLSWTLHMYQFQDVQKLLGINVGGLLLAVLFIGGVIIVCAVLALRSAMRPVAELDNKSYEQSIKEQMLNPGLLPDRAFSFRHDRYFVLLMQFTESDAERLEHAFNEEIVWPDNIERHLIPIQVGHTAMVVSYNGEDRERFWRDWLNHTHRRLESVLETRLFFAVSMPRKSTRALSEAYQETMLMSNYTMQRGELRVIFRSDITPAIEIAEYPEALEKQLINNLLIGDMNTCGAIVEELISMLFNEQSPLQNQEILAWLTRLESRVLMQVASIPIRLPEDIQSEFSIWDTRKTISEKLLHFAQTIISRVNKRVVEKHEDLEQRIREYVGQNFTDPNFSFTSICDHFSIGRSQLTAIFREKMGGSFSEYVNELKIEKAKQLLCDKKLTIDTIAHEAGFSYAHYFIKVFKAKEGVTPGQYREHIGGTESAAPLQMENQTDNNQEKR